MRSSVTIDDLACDYYNDHTDKSFQASDVEVVPRKMIEMIIDYCLQQEVYFESIGLGDVEIGLHYARKYAESLLTKFEED